MCLFPAPRTVDSHFSPLCSPVTGAKERIATLRYRYEVVSASLASLDERVARNTAELESMRRSYHDNEDYRGTPSAQPQPEVLDISDDDIARELGEIRDLESRKRALEERVSEMEKDLGGLMR